MQFTHMGVGVVLLTAACSGGESIADGARANLQVRGGTFFAGRPSAAVDGGPTVSSIGGRLFVKLGQADIPFSGELTPPATSAAIFLRGDPGYWILPASVGDDATNPLNASFATTLAFQVSTPLVDGGLPLQLNGIDEQGNWGPALPYTLRVVSAGPAGSALVISLNWDTEADLDLHVETPAGIDIWSGQESEFQSQSGLDVSVIRNFFGYLDLDSNRNCVIDGLRNENVIWQDFPDAGPKSFGYDGGREPPSGNYIVRVQTHSMCGQAFANWTVQATYQTLGPDGGLISQDKGLARGEALPIDTSSERDDAGHIIGGAGAGITALQFTIP